MYLEYTDVDGEKNGAYQTKRLEYKTLEKREKSLYLKRRKRRRMKRIIPLTPRRWLALEIFRRMKHERVEEHPLRQLFGNAPYDVMYVAAIVAVTASPLPLLRICLCRIF